MLLLLTLLLAVTDPLTPYMSEEEQKKSGIDRLTIQEKENLAEWLSTHKYQQTHQELTLSLNIRSGEILQLSDGTLWQVAPKDVQTASSWLSPVKIEFKQSSNVAYPLTLINTATHETVMVHPLQSLKTPQ